MNQSTGEYILSSVSDHVGTITLHRPNALNAFNLDLAEQFLAALDAFNRDEAVRVIVVNGSGNVFSSGGDIKEMLGYVRDGKDRAAYFRAPLAAFGRMVLALRASPKPVVGAVHGAVAGFAFNLMLEPAVLAPGNHLDVVQHSQFLVRPG